ncbi:MAG: cytochrome c [bacterium]|nr:cytochrome c [bacterium]
MQIETANNLAKHARSAKSHKRKRNGGRYGLCLAAAVFVAAACATWNAGADQRSGALFAQTKQENDTAAIMRGRRIFEKRCVMCHGVTGKGDGIRAMSLPVRPANLSTSKMSDAEKARIIEKGGAAVGRSPLMPVWGNEFSKKEIGDLVKYLRAINIARK